MIRTAESVKRGHPDKICDQISDAILDECLKQDKNSRAAIEVMGGHGIITVCGELTTNAYVDIREVVMKVYKDIGHNDDNIGVQVNVVKQSPDISQGVDTGGAGDQGVMVGYACNDNKAMIPHELYLARLITNGLEELQSYSDKVLPDGKAQVTIDDNNQAIKIVISNQTTDEADLKKRIMDHIIPPIPKAKGCEIFINPTGKFLIGGFDADTGLTGRKIVIDAYGPRVAVGGGAFSGKDPSKVDRSAAYMARHVAVKLLKQWEAQEVTVKVAYCIGKAEPMMANAIIIKSDAVIEKELDKQQFTPKNIIKTLKLKDPKYVNYYKTAQHGHFGNGFIWDK